MLQEVKQVVVFWHHLEPLESMIEKLSHEGIKCEKIVGSMSIKDRQAAIDRFQNGYAQVILLTYGAGAEGITLTSSHTMLMCECEWTPAKMLQAEDRCCRIGQKNSINIRYLVIEGTIDARVAQVAKTKNDIIDEILIGDSLEI
jgi:SNF2 family DNA or RNA helicase